jgi:hypothetical protein
VALAATPDLTVVTNARYDVRPDLGRIDVTVDLTATNRLVDTSTTHYVSEQAFLAVPPEAQEFAVSATSGRPTVEVSESKPTYTLLRIVFGTSLAAGRSTQMALTYALVDRGTPPDRDFRVGATLTTFPVWALASTDTPGSTVAVTVPDGYNVSFLRGSITGPTSDSRGRQVWTSDPIEYPLKFDLFLRADRPPELVSTQVSVPVGGGSVRLILRAWADDPGWADRIGELYEDGIAALETAIGLPWPLSAPLTLDEVLDPPQGGIAGSFDPVSNRIEVVYSAGPEVALHEAAHAWFNGGFLADRWANEGFASYYAEVAAGELGLPFEPAEVTPELDGAQVPLNAWASGDAQPPEGADRSAVEAYGYAASAELARRLAEQADRSWLRRVWAAIDAGRAPYQPPGGPTEYLDGPPDWRVLLDLFEDDGSTRVAYLWSARVVLPSEANMLSERDAARRAYADALERAGDWSLPRAIRDAMRGWQFATARDQLAIAATVLDQRDELTSAAAAAGVTLPAGLRERFAQASDLSAVRTEVDADLKAVAAIRAAQAARPSAPGPVEWIGLIGSSPDQQLRESIKVLAAGDPTAAATAASAAEATWRAAVDAGSLRIAGLAGAATVVMLMAAIWLRRRRTTVG